VENQTYREEGSEEEKEGKESEEGAAESAPMG